MNYQFPFDEWLKSIPEWQRFMTVEYGNWIAEKELEKQKVILYSRFNQEVDHKAHEIVKDRVKQAIEKEIGSELRRAENGKKQQRLHWERRIKEKDDEIERLIKSVSTLELEIARIHGKGD